MNVNFCAAEACKLQELKTWCNVSIVKYNRHEKVRMGFRTVSSSSTMETGCNETDGLVRLYVGCAQSRKCGIFFNRAKKNGSMDTTLLSIPFCIMSTISTILYVVHTAICTFDTRLELQVLYPASDGWDFLCLNSQLDQWWCSLPSLGV